MATNILHKRNALTGVAPSTAQIALGEIAINTFDGKLYVKSSDSAIDGAGTEAIVEIGAGGGAQTPWTSDIDSAGFNLTTGAGVDVQLLQGGHAGDTRTAGLGLYATDPILIESNGLVNIKGGGQYGSTIEVDLATIKITSATVQVTGDGTAATVLLKQSDGSVQGTTLQQGSDNTTAVLFRLPPNNGAAGDVLTNAAGDGVTTWAAPAGGGSQTPWTSNIDSAGFSLITADTTGITNANAITAKGGYAIGSGTGGPINLSAGDSYSGNGGNAQLSAGYGGSGGYAGTGGSLTLTAGNSYQDPGGAVNITAGTTYGTAAAGTINITAGASGAAYGGNVTLTPGTGATYTGNVRSAGNFIVLKAGGGADVLNASAGQARVAINGTPNESTGALQVTGDLHVEGGVNYREGVGNTVPLATYMGGTNFFVVRDYADVYTVQQIWSPPGAVNSADQEATLALVRGDEPNQEFLDLYNNGYLGVEEQFGIRMQKRGTGVFRPFVIDYDDGTTKTPVLTINTDTTVDFASAITTAGGVDALTTATGIVSVAAATAPTAGQVLKATAATTATWQTLVEADISDLGTYEPADGTILKDVDIGVNVQAYDANILTLQNNMNATVAPAGATDDVTLGYAVGSRWFDTTADKEYVCLDNTDTAAVWIETTQGGGGVANPLTADLDTGGNSIITAAASGANANAINITAGDGTASNQGGAINITGGGTNTYLSIPGSPVTISGGYAKTGPPGKVIITGGDGNHKTGQAGDVDILGGNNNYQAVVGTYTNRGGNILIQGGYPNKTISTTFGGNVKLVPGEGGSVANAGVIQIGSAGGTGQGGIDILDEAAGYKTTLKVASLAVDTTFQLPATDGTNGQVLATNGSGVTSWATSGGGVTNPLTADLDTGGYSIITAAASGANADNISITGGAGSGSYTASTINITAGDSTGDFGGGVNITAGAGDGEYSTGGDVSIIAGAAQYSGNPGAGFSSGGDIIITSGDTTDSNGIPGNVTISTAGYTGSNSDAAGNIILKPGAINGAAVGGLITLTNNGGSAKIEVGSGATIDVTGELKLDTFSETINSIATTGAVTLNVANGTYFYNVATTGIITFTFTNPPTSARAYTMTLELFGGGTNAPGWPASVKWPGGTEPTWSTGIDVVTFITRDQGTTWLGMLGGTAFA